MQIGILQADSVLEQFQGAHGNYPGMIETILTDAAASLGISVNYLTYNVEQGQYPGAVGDCDGYIITGSKKSVYDGDPWIAALIDFVRVLHKEQVRLVGICFGHQLIAEALGGRTTAAKIGWGVGVHNSDVCAQAWFMKPELDRFSLIVSHKDQVTKLPDEARLLAGSDFCPNSMFSIGDHILAMQGHPEFSRAYAADLMNWRKDIIGTEIYKQGMSSLEGPLSHGEVSAWILRFLMAGADRDSNGGLLQPS
ncbi:MAG: GMP synthase [Gammaproteobacteria bacterium]|nr:GMP synthase [Gammaproteobacteria bacterium]